MNRLIIHVLSMENSKRKYEKVASVGRGQVWFAPVAVQAAIDESKRAVSMCRRPSDEICEWIRLGDFCSRHRCILQGVEAYESAIECCLSSETRRYPQFREQAFYCAEQLARLWRSVGNDGERSDFWTVRLKRFYGHRFSR